MVGRLLAAIVVPLLFIGCKGDAPPAAPPDGSVTVTIAVVDPNEAGTDGGAPGGPRIAALALRTPIFSGTEWPPRDPAKATEERANVINLGYLRMGSTAAVKPEIIKKPNCPEGWYELVEGGFVCGRFATMDFHREELANAPHPPFTDGPLPYQYGLNLTNGTPLYNRVPTKKERRRFEATLGGAGDVKGAQPDSAGADESEQPWYLRDHKGAKPQVSFEELHNEKPGGVVDQRIVRGFYLSLDKQLDTDAGKFWRTTRGLLTPFDQVIVHESKTEFEGVQLGATGETRKLPIGFVLGFHAHRYLIEELDEAAIKVKKEPKVRRGDKIERFSILGMNGKKGYFDRHDFVQLADGAWIRELDVTITNPGPPPPDLKPNEKWIDVNLTTQTLVAFEGDRAVYATLISSGKHNVDDPEKNHRTARGSFRIREKHISSTMDDDSASDGPYSIQDVPWIMYFHGGYALHGAFWHSAFGHERSHGCVNLTPHDAKALFAWAGPRLPPGWHGVHETDTNPGTRVLVHE